MAIRRSLIRRPAELLDRGYKARGRHSAAQA
jgi:hypothetical protein